MAGWARSPQSWSREDLGMVPGRTGRSSLGATVAVADDVDMGSTMTDINDVPEVKHLPLRIMIVDDHDVVRSGLRSLIEAAGELVVAEAATCDEAVEEALRSKPQVIVMDVRLGEQSGVTATREIRARIPDAKVIMLTSFPDEEALAASLLVGASGFILKEVAGDDIIKSIRAVARGEQAFDPNLLVGGAFHELAQKVSPRSSGPSVRPVPTDQGPPAVED